ncbi:SWI/SNF-related matrix-associated actin-dependent regulator of chromatin subfamily B member 1, partial [Tremellales sp. Uapishka_1]
MSIQPPPHQSPAPSGPSFPISFQPQFTTQPPLNSDPRHGNINFLPPAQQQQYLQTLNAPSSTVPGASGGRGDPGPQSQGFRPTLNNMNAHQRAMMQQLTQAARGGPNPGFTPQQMAMAMSVIQDNANNGNPQGAAMMAGGKNGMPMGQPNQQPPQQGGPTDGNLQNPHSHQQRLQQLMQQGQGINPDMARLQAQGQLGRASPANSMGSPSRPPQQQPPQQQGMMAPPPLPQGSSPRPPNVPPSNPQQQQPFRLPPGFMPTPQQQQILSQQQQQLVASPQFQSMPQQQQQFQMAQMHQHLLRGFAMQQGIPMGQPIGQPQQQQQQQQQQQMQQQQQQQLQMQQGQQMGQPIGHLQQQQQQQQLPQQSPLIQRQPTPNQQHLSSLPQHMAPPRPASAASHHAPSPPPVHAPSPTPSNVSHHSGHPQQRSDSPMGFTQQRSVSANSNGPGANFQLQQPPPPQQQQPQQFQPPPSGQPQFPPQTAQVVQALTQHARDAQSMIQNGQMPQFSTPPVQPQVGFPGQQNLTPAQQQQMATAMGLISQVAQNQQRPPARPPMIPPNINTSDFPFDFRLLAYMANANDPRWMEDVRSKNPQFHQAIQSAQARVMSGTIRPDILERMNQVLMLSVKNTAGQRAVRPPPGVQGPGFGPNPPGAVPPTQQQRLWNQGQASPSPTQSSMGRPPPPHLPPSSASPKSLKKELDRERTPSQMAMPPPAWIPSHQASQGPAPPSLPSRSETTDPPPNPIPVKEWEARIRRDLPITSITSLPVEEMDEADDPTFGGALPAMTEEEVANVHDWIERDKEYVKLLASSRTRSKEKTIKWAKNEDAQSGWWRMSKGERMQIPRGRLKIVWPADKTALRSKTSHRGRREIRFSPAQLKSMANVEDQVVPVRLDLEYDHWKLKDTFMWNCSDVVVTPELFAQCLCDDFSVPPHHFVPKIVAAIRERVREYQDQVLPMVSNVSECDTGARGRMDPEGNEEARSLVEVFRKAREGESRVKQEEGVEDEGKIRTVSFVGEDERPMTVQEVLAGLGDVGAEEELRITIKVDIIVGTQNLSDSFEWDLNSSVTPEEFAASYVKDLGLNGEFATALAHDIHEQILVHKRSLFLVGHTFGAGIILDDDVRQAFLPAVTVALRKEDVAMSSFTPIFNTLTEADIERLEKEREKESKRKKRATRGRRGVILPDREPLKTRRSLLNNALDPRLAQPEPPVVQAPVQTGRRAAAIAAQANINLLAQDLPLPQPPSPLPPPPSSRSRRPVRNGRGVSRASPTLSETINGGVKRSFREDSSTVKDLNSPVPARKRRVVDSPDEEEVVKPDPGVVLSPPPLPEALSRKRKSDASDDMDMEKERASKAIKPTNGTWHCKNCGIPKHLTDLQRKGPDGARSLCGACARFLSRTGRQRSCEYVEDEEYHRRRLAGGKRRKDDSTSPSPSSRQSSVSSESQDSDSTFGSDRPTLKMTNSHRATTTPGRSVQPQSPAVNASPNAGRKPGVEPPQWLMRSLEETRSRYPKHDFAVVQKPKPEGEPVEWRIKCMDCPGRIYTTGPEHTLQNFEVHLKNRAHIMKVQARDPTA